MTIRVCVAGATGWTGREIVSGILASSDLELVSAIARRQAGVDVGAAIGRDPVGIKIAPSLAEVLATPTDVLIDYTSPDSVKDRVLAALGAGIRVVVGTSGLTADDYKDIEERARKQQLGVIAAGNFSLAGALAKHLILIAARYLPSWEIIDYGTAEKIDSPSGTTRELAEELAAVAKNQVVVPVERTYGSREARGAKIGGTQVHSLRLPGYYGSHEVIFGLCDERLSIRQDGGPSAKSLVSGTLLAARRVMEVRGLVRGLDKLLFHP